MTKRKTTRNGRQGNGAAKTTNNKKKATMPVKTAGTRKNAGAPKTTVEKKTPARQSEPNGTKEKNVIVKIIDPESRFPNEFPFWARLKIGKNRTTLVIDEDLAKNKNTNKMEEGFVHREAIHSNPRGDYEEINPNPDREDPRKMYLKRPQKIPKRLVKPHNKELDMPESLKKRYEKNNHKPDGDNEQ